MRPITRHVLFTLAVACALPTLSWAQTTPTPPTLPTTPTPPPAVVGAFPTDTQIAFVNLERIFQESAFGKTGMAQVTTLQNTLNTGLQVRARDIQALSEKIKSQQTVAAEATLMAWNTDLLRLQREAQFAQQEAQIQVEQMQNTLLASFEKLVQPVIENVRKEKGLWFVFALPSAQADTSGLTLLAADPALDLSAEVLKRMVQ
ncbi:MAG: hypothetical protein AMXMBFR57_05930 [Acidimicrobiia bacterium]